MKEIVLRYKHYAEKHELSDSIWKDYSFYQKVVNDLKQRFASKIAKKIYIEEYRATLDTPHEELVKNAHYKHLEDTIFAEMTVD